MKRFLPFLTLIFFAILITAATYKSSQKHDNGAISEDLTSVEESDIHFSEVKISLPDFSLPNLFDESKNFSKKDLIGKYSVINFFASWCTTCRAEHEILLRLHDENIVDIYGIAWRDIDKNTKKYLEKNGNPYKGIAKDNKGLFTKITGIEAIPETLIVDENGVVVRRYRGNLQDFSIDEIKEFLNRK